MEKDILRYYLLSIEGLWAEEAPPKGISQGALQKESAEEKESGGFLERAFCRVDEKRREKAAAMRPGRGQAASLGAGLLLQLALGEMSGMSGVRGSGETETELPGRQKSFREEPGRQMIPCYTAGQLLTHLESMPRFPVVYRYGENGKPYFRDYPFYFSLSHSGDYVLCAVSRRDLGADIQQWRKCDTGRVAERFFSAREREALEEIGRNQGGEGQTRLFFRLWARKEAYGKLTGRGIGDAAGVNLLPEREAWPEDRRLCWMETLDFPGYSMAVCRYE